MNPDSEEADSSLLLRARTRTVSLWITWIVWAACAARPGEALSPRSFPPRAFHASERYRPCRPGPGDLGRRLHSDEADHGRVPAVAVHRPGVCHHRSGRDAARAEESHVLRLDDADRRPGRQRAELPARLRDEAAAGDDLESPAAADGAVCGSHVV